jgi:preprotein translocase subunit SecE
VAQLVEQWSPKPKVVGSIPTTRASKRSKEMADVRAYMKETYDEMVHKVSWPTWKNLQNSAVVVLFATFIFAVVIYIMDLGFGQLMDLIYTKIFN